MAKIIMGLFLITGLLLFVGHLWWLGAFNENTYVDFLNLSLFGTVLAFWGSVGALVLWLWMLTDFFMGYPNTNRVVWGWFLFIGTFFAATLYFFSVYACRILRKDHSENGS